MFCLQLFFVAGAEWWFEETYNRGKITFSYLHKAFNNSGHLKIHERTCTGEKKFACSKCVKSFKQNGDLKKHERAHTGEKHCSFEDT